MRKLTLLLTALMLALAGYADGNRFLNPVIPADFPDPDVAKLGDTYYFLSTTMYLMPGATVLKSHDLVNWEYCCNPLEHMSDADKYSLIGGQYSYAQGMWAGAIEEHDGKLYILLNCNDAGAFVLSTDNPEGKWEKKRLSRSYYDPGMIIEGDRIYIVCGINDIHICELDLNWNLLKDTSVVKREGTGLEGSHLYHIGDYYYIYSTYGGWPTGQTIFRSKNITGPYEEKMLMEKWINGAANTVHQGALMQTNAGEWWTLLMEDKGAIGRLPSLHPVVWEDGWPTIAAEGVPQPYYDLPNVGATYPEVSLDADDNFRTWQLGKQWQWNHNAPTGYWSLMDRPGCLRLSTSSVTDDFMLARGTLTQRIMARHRTTSPYGLDSSNPSSATIAIDVSRMKAGDVAGIAVQQDPYAMLGVTLDEKGNYGLLWKKGSHTNTDNFTPGERTYQLKSWDPANKVVYLRAKFNAGNSEATFYYSADNKNWRTVGEKTQLRFNLSVFVGARWAIFNYATKNLGGYVDIDWFSTQDDVVLDEIEPAGFEGFADDVLTVKSLSLPGDSDELQLMIDNPRDIKLTATFVNGRTEDVSARAAYTVEWPQLITIDGGRFNGRREGTTTVKAAYTDPKGNTIEKTFTASASFFPFSEDYIKSVWGTNTYDPATRGFKTDTNGQMGWEYDNPVNMSRYKYMVIRLDQPQTCDADIRIYAQSSIWGGSTYIKKLGNDTEVVIDLQAINYTDGDKKGQPVDLNSIYKVLFWSKGTSVIDVADVYLTNRRDFDRENGTETGDDIIQPILYSAKAATANNPINTFNFCADPTALEYDGKVYLYGTNDHQQFEAFGFDETNNYGLINSLVCMSSSDMVNWTWHSPIQVKQIAPWTGCSWAPSACSKTGADGKTRFYLYFANGASGIGVLTADSPTGPWRDPLGKPLIRPGHPGMGHIVWLFDPGVVVDDNGDGWLTWGGGGEPSNTGNKLIDNNTRIAKLGDDMISFASEMVILPAPYHFEASELNIIGGKYVYTYCSNWDGDRSQWDEFEYYDHSKAKPAAPGGAQMCYMTSTDPLNPESWQYQGAYLDHPGGNNHTHLQKVGTSYFLFYHSEKYARAINGDGRGYRSIGADRITVNESKCEIPKISMTDAGAPQLRNGRPNTTDLQEAEMMWNSAGIKPQAGNEPDQMWVVPTQAGAWTAVKQTATRDEVISFKATLRGKGTLEVRLNNLNSEPVASIAFDSDTFEEYAVRLTEAFKGNNTIYFVFSQVDSDDVAFDKWQFFVTDETYITSAETDASIVGIEYYDLSGMRIENPQTGIYIRRAILSDGTIRADKWIKR